MGQAAAKEAGKQAVKGVGKQATKPVSAQTVRQTVAPVGEGFDKSGPGAAVLNAFSQQLINKRNMGISAEDFSSIASRVDKHGTISGKDEVAPSPVHMTAESPGVDVVRDRLKRKLKAREPISNVKYNPSTTPDEASKEYVEMQKMLKTKMGVVEKGPILAPDPSAPASPIRKVSRIPQKQSSVLTSTDQLQQKVDPLKKEQAVSPELQEGLKKVGLFKKRAKLVMGQKQTNIALESIGNSGSMSDGAWYAMLLARRAKGITMAEVQSKASHLSPEVLNNVCKYFDAHEVQRYNALHVEALKKHSNRSSQLPNSTVVTMGGFHAFPRPPIPLQ